SDRLLVLAVPDATALAGVLDRLQPAGGADRSVMVVGLRAAPGRANSAPLLVLDPATDRGLPTSDSPPPPGRAARVAARPWAIPLLCLAAVLALGALLATWRGGGATRPARAARTLLALTLALPAGYLLASMAEPLAGRLWQSLVSGPPHPGPHAPCAAAS